MERTLERREHDDRREPDEQTLERREPVEQALERRALARRAHAASAFLALVSLVLAPLTDADARL